ncbi:MAG: chemotaxis protein CheV [Gammaproteobacteria bacterium]|nr:chemotaxis protein CheV [Gammaproteobacteria bacterium]
MTNFIQSVDERTQLAGTNRLEVLLFSLGKDTETGRDEVFGINVFKVREVMHVPEITHAPNMPDSVEGMVSLRGSMVPVINLQTFCSVKADEGPKILMVTEYNKNVQGFLVHSVDNIERLDWDNVKAPPAMLVSRLGGLVTAVSELDNKKLVMIMDVEKVLADTAILLNEETLYDGIEKHDKRDHVTILYADDSVVARDQIAKTLDHMGIDSIMTKNGKEAWERLKQIADKADTEGRPVTDYINLILTDVEMPEMDGYVLTRKIKADQRFNGLKVVMHSSLTAEANQALGKGVGADAYVPKFQPIELSATLDKIINGDE